MERIKSFVEQYTIEAGLRRAETLDEFEELLDVYSEKRLDEEKIDDGCDGSEDNYVMMRRYSLSVKGYKRPFTVRVYYGDVTREVGHVEISNNEANPSEEDYKNMPTSDLFQVVCEGCSKETILEQAEGYLGDDKVREFLLACLGVDIE